MFTRSLRSLPPPRHVCIPRTPTTYRAYSDALQSNHSFNEGIIDMLTRDMKEEDASPSRNVYKVRSFQNAISVIREVKKPVSSGQEAAKLKGIGLGIAQRIDLFLGGQEYDPQKHEQARVHRKRAVSALQGVPGIGRISANQLYDAGCTSVAQLDEPRYQEMLSAVQRTAVKYRDHLDRELSREDAESIASFTREHISSKFELHLLDAYRRHTPITHLTLLLQHPAHIHIPLPERPATSAQSLTRGKPSIPFHRPLPTGRGPRAPLLKDVVRPLQDAGLLVGTLGGGGARWSGVAHVPGATMNAGELLRATRLGRGRYCRVELSMAPWGSRGAALLALTGDAEYYRALRIAADKLGMHLNEYGLWRWQAKGTGGYWELVESEREEHIVRELGLDWVAPEKRNFAFLKAGAARTVGRPRKVAL